MARGDDILQAITARASRASDVEIWDKTPNGILVRRDVFTDAQRVRRNRFELVRSVGLLYYDTGGGFASIDEAIGDDSGGAYSDRVESTPYVLRVAPDSSRRYYPRRNVTDEYVDFGIVQQGAGSRFAPLDFAASRNRSTPTRLAFTSTEGVSLVIETAPGRVKVTLVYSSAPANPDIRFPFTLHGLTLRGSELVSAGDGSVVGGFPVPIVHKSGAANTPAEYLQSRTVPDYTLTDSALTVRVNWSTYGPGDFPVYVDPTVDVSVGSGANNAYAYGLGWYPSEAVLVFGNDGSSAINVCLRWTGVTIPNAATISACTITGEAPSGWSSGSPCNMNVYFNNADNPAMPANVSAFNALSLTSAVAWNSISSSTGTLTTPSLVSILQTVVNRAGWASGNAIVSPWRDNGSSSAFRGIEGYNYSPSPIPAALHATYSTAATGPGPIWNQP